MATYKVIQCYTSEQHGLSTSQARSTRALAVFEYPRSEGDPYYPIPQPANAALYQSYKLLADTLPNVHFVGRLGTYKYYNMDQVVGQALALFEKLSARAVLSSKTPVVMPSEAIAGAGPDQTAEPDQIQQKPGEAA